MVTLRVMAGAFIMNGNDILLMKRAESKSFYPGLWAIVGGHVEPNEMNNPQDACLREIREETGLCESDLLDLTLKYIVLRRAKDEIRLSYIYFATAKSREYTDCDEGELHWISKTELFNRQMSALNELVLKHYLQNNDSTEIFTGTLILETDKPSIRWSVLSSWEGY